MLWPLYETQEFEFSNIRLIPVNFDHTDLIVQWRNSPDNKKWFTSTADIAAADHRAWLSRQRSAGTNMNWIIESFDRRPVGMISVYNVDFPDGRGEFGRLLVGDPTDRAKGYGFKASKLAAEIAHRSGLSELYLFVKTDNITAISLYRKIGFIEHGTDGEVLEMRLALTDIAKIDIVSRDIKV